MKYFFAKTILMLTVLFASQNVPAQEQPKPLLIDSFAIPTPKSPAQQLTTSLMSCFQRLRVKT